MPVVVVGSANQDLTSYTSVIPKLGETVTGESFATSSGGKGANQARAAASLSQDVHMVCRVGDDVFGKDLLENLESAGVQVDRETTVLSGVSSGVASIVVDTESGDNCIIVTPGANHKLTCDDVDRALRKLKPKVVVTQLEVLPEVALQAMKTAKDLNALTILNPAPAPEASVLEPFYPYSDIVIPNESELATLMGGGDEVTNARTLLTKGVGKAVIVTLGARGAMVVPKEGEVFYVSQPEGLTDLPVLDTVGAGDAFCGSLASYLSAGLDLKEAGPLACGFASLSVRRRGASYPSADELPESLQLKAAKSL